MAPSTRPILQDGGDDRQVYHTIVTEARTMYNQNRNNFVEWKESYVSPVICLPTYQLSESFSPRWTLDPVEISGKSNLEEDQLSQRRLLQTIVNIHRSLSNPPDLQDRCHKLLESASARQCGRWRTKHFRAHNLTYFIPIVLEWSAIYEAIVSGNHDAKRKATQRWGNYRIVLFYVGLS